MSVVPCLHLFEGYGLELEYMIVAADTLDVAPLTDVVLHTVSGAYESEVERGPLCWSNELMLHVVELKTNGPVSSLDAVEPDFQEGVRAVNAILRPLGARLMPTAMHPWMDPFAEARLWPHENSPIYEAFDRIFDCRGHGWSNLQSAHINLPFCGDDEFGRLHSAIRLVLPLLPAVAASSPFAEGCYMNALDHRLQVYRTNAARVPSISGLVIPEGVFTREDYESRLLQRLYDDIEPYDPEGILHYEWLNARGAIARFERNTIEIRVLDIQECPKADVAIAALVTAVIRALAEERWCSMDRLMAWREEPLSRLLDAVEIHGEEAMIEDRNLLECLGITGTSRSTVGAVWQHLYGAVLADASASERKTLAPIETIIKHGPLARRIVRCVGADPDRRQLRSLYNTLCDCLEAGILFDGAL